MNSQKLNLSTPNMLGGIGGIFIILGFLFKLLPIVGLILILVAFYQYSQILNKPSIFQYGLRWAIFLFVAEILLIFFAIAEIIGNGNIFLEHFWTSLYWLMDWLSLQLLILKKL